MARRREEIDDSLYSRQRYVLGDTAMKRMAHSSVLLVGFGGLGVEIAKNVTLAGVKSLTVLDDAICRISDLSTQYFIRESDVKARKTRVDAGIRRLAELNPHVIVTGISEPLGKRNDSWIFLRQYKCVILTEVPFEQQIEVNEYCRSQNPPIAFISGDVVGLFGYGFCDFGYNFEIYDSNGEEPKEVFICNITSEEPAVVTVFDARPHGFETGDWIEFKEVAGMTELNGKQLQITVLTPYQFTINGTNGMSKYTGGGIACEIKRPKKMNFRSLREELADPTVSTPDLAKFDAPSTIHLCFQVYYNNVDNSDMDYDQSLGEVKKLATKSQVDVNEKLAKAFYLGVPGCFAPLCTVFGGVLAQEALKAASGKFTPLNQWLHMDCCEVLSEKDYMDRDYFYLHVEDRYDSLRACVGQDILEKLHRLKLFMIGCGAIGCEMMKLFALLGIGTSNGQGKLTVTDNDLIEKSNLNRQFLFRPQHVKHSKSVTAAASSRDMNPQLNIEAQQYKVHAGTEEEIHTDDFFLSQDMIVNALDNVEARVYIDQRCVDTGRPLLESGTTGAKGHTQIIVPHLTESYSSQRDPLDEDVPFCTLKSFPANLDHCIAWARDKFENSFNSKPHTFNKFWEENGDIQLVTQRVASGEIPKNSAMISKLLKSRPSTWKDCVHLARQKFESYFAYEAEALLYAYPLDHIRNDGEPFWRLPRRPPHPIRFDPAEKHHMDFVKATAFLFARLSGLKISREDRADEVVRPMLQDVHVPPFTPNSDKKIAVDEDDTAPPDVSDMEVDEREILDVFSTVCASGDAKFALTPLVCQEFEKDNDLNGHIDYIVSAANLRAEMYGINTADRYTIKRVAGKIIPAIATTTATVAGLITIEIFKLIRKAPLENYKNCFLNLALPAMVLSEPGAAKVTKIREGLSFTLWDKISVKGNEYMTMRQFIQKTTDVVGQDVDMVLQGSKIIYSALIPTYRKKADSKMSSLVRPVGNKSYVDLTVCFSGLPDQLAAEIPPVRYHF